MMESVVAQTTLPTLWLIVDDGSTDQTPQILTEYADKYDLIRIVRSEDRGERSVGRGVIDAFYAGLDSLGFVQADQNKRASHACGSVQVEARRCNRSSDNLAQHDRERQIIAFLGAAKLHLNGRPEE